MKHNRLGKVIRVWTLTMCLLLSILPVPVCADEIESDGENMVYISSTDDLLELAENCRVNTWSIGKTVILMDDIDLTGSSFSGIPTFGGTFYGGDNTIKGFNLTESGSVVGFFRYLQESAVIEGLSLEATIQPTGSKSVVGGFAGNNAGTIRNCTFKGTVTGYEQIGGFVGINEITGLIENCTVNGSIHGSHFVGGIAGENHGVIRQTLNSAEVNTKSIQNSVNIEDITLDNLINTESANTATDIGGIAGISSGIIRECTNTGDVGYQSMGYNVGGIAGAQNGYLVDCINQGDIQGRKEVGGIVGHMEPNIVLDYDIDSFQTLSQQLQELSVVLKELRATIEKSSTEINNEMDALEKDINTIENALDVISEELKLEEQEETDLENLISQIEDIDFDRISAALSDLSSSVADAYERISNLQILVSEFSDKVTTQLNEVVKELDKVIGTVENMDDNLNFSITDVSDEDTEEDTLGKVSNSVNYGKVSGELNVGGIAGVLADETDLDTYEDVEISGDISLNGSYRMRVVVRDCKNFGTIAASKQYVGGITGQMVVGAVLECINMGNLDAISADYVGGIAGKSYSVIRNCSSKSIIAGDTYVGGIVGEGDEVTDCYAFISMEAYTEKAGAIMGNANNLPEGTEEDLILRNFYFITGKDIGGIDGISYTCATDKVDLEGFLQLPELDDLLRTVTIRFLVEGVEEQVISINVGDSLDMNSIPVIEVENEKEYNWELVPTVVSKLLGMGETIPTEYISKESLTDILFDQTYEAAFDLKTTVIKGTKKNETGLATILAEGIFAKNTSIEITDILSDVASIDGKEVVDGWNVTLSNTGVSKLHYLIPEGMHAEYVKLYIQTSDKGWKEREFVVDGSYAVFEFADGDVEFAFVEDYSGIIQTVAIAGGGVAIVLCVCVVIFILKKLHKKTVRKAS